MGPIISYFFDTYAFFEILKGNPNYENYREEPVIITTKLNLMELHYCLMIEKGKGTADHYYDKYEKYAVDFDAETIKKANELKAKHRKLNLSYIDCIGYTIAKNNGIRFLTGDKGFKDLENVEFVK